MIFVLFFSGKMSAIKENFMMPEKVRRKEKISNRNTKANNIWRKIFLSGLTSGYARFIKLDAGEFELLHFDEYHNCCVILSLPNFFFVPVTDNENKLQRKFAVFHRAISSTLCFDYELWRKKNPYCCLTEGEARFLSSLGLDHKITRVMPRVYYFQDV